MFGFNKGWRRGYDAAIRQKEIEASEAEIEAKKKESAAAREASEAKRQEEVTQFIENYKKDPYPALRDWILEKYFTYGFRVFGSRTVEIGTDAIELLFKLEQTFKTNSKEKSAQEVIDEINAYFTKKKLVKDHD